MRFEACERPKRKKGFVPTKIFKLITEFGDAEIPVARVYDYEQSSVYTAAKSINAATKRFNMTHIHAFVANGNLYIENRALTEQSK